MGNFCCFKTLFQWNKFDLFSCSLAPSQVLHGVKQAPIYNSGIVRSSRSHPEDSSVSLLPCRNSKTDVDSDFFLKHLLVKVSTVGRGKFEICFPECPKAS